MKTFFFTCWLCCAVAATSIAQEKITPLDQSPMDMSYYPPNFPILKVQDKVTGNYIVRAIYGRPSKNGRKIFGDLISYGKIWRMGANEATEVEFSQDATINKVKIKKGRYTIYSIPLEDKWTLIINKETDTWGSFKYDPKKDVVKVDVPVEKLTEPIETFTLLFEKFGKDIRLQILWDDVKVVLPITIP